MSSSDVILECPVCLRDLERSAQVEMFGSEGRQWPGRRFDCSHCGKFIVDEIEFNHMLG
jgi:hypothetical protein